MTTCSVCGQPAEQCRRDIAHRAAERVQKLRTLVHYRDQLELAKASPRGEAEGQHSGENAQNGCRSSARPSPSLTEMSGPAGPAADAGERQEEATVLAEALAGGGAP